MTARPPFTLVSALVLLVFVPAALWAFGNPYAGRLAQLLALTIVLTSALNLLTGTAGLLALDSVVWYGLGAYTAAILSTGHGTGVLTELAVAIVLATVLGTLIGAALVRLVSIFFAVATLGLAVGFFTAALNWSDLTRGAMGIRNIPPLVSADAPVPPWLGNYWPAALCAVVALAVVHRLTHSYYGNALRGVREDEEAAASLGLHPRRLKMQAYAVHAVLMASAGVIYAHANRFIGPDNFVLLESAFVLTAVVVGGLGSLFGAIFGAAIVVLLPEALREAGNLRTLVFGLVLFLSILFLPRGLARESGSLARMRRWFAGGTWSGTREPPR